MAPGSQNPAVGHLISLRAASPVHLLVGNARPAVKFSFRGVLSHEGALRDMYRLPLAELGYACRVANTRYGYIQTEEELVVCRFSNSTETGDGVDNPKDMTVEIASVRWGDSVRTTPSRILSVSFIRNRLSRN